MRIRRYFEGAEIAQMSSGTYCIIRPLGLVKGGKGLKHHENLLTLTATGIASKFVACLGHLASRLQSGSVQDAGHVSLSHSLEGESPAVVRTK